MLKAAQLMRQGAIGSLFADKAAVPIEQTYKLASLMERPGAKEIILQAAKNLGREAEGKREAGDILRSLLGSLDRSRKFEPIQKQYNVGVACRVLMTRNARGKITLAFTQGLQGIEPAEVLSAVEKILKDIM